MPLPTILLLYRFLADWNLHMTQGLQIALPTTFTLPFFCTSGTLHARYIRAIFELQARPFCSSLVVSFFRCFYERNSIHTASLSHFISRSLGSPSVLFYPALYHCWIHVNDRTPLVVSLNDEFRLAHRRQQSAVFAFQFHHKNIFRTCSETLLKSLINI